MNERDNFADVWAVARLRPGVTVDGAPKVHPLSTDGDKHFVGVSPIIGSWSEASDRVRIFSSEFEHPPPDRFIRYVETSPGQQIFHVSEAQREAAIEPNGVLDDFSRQAVAPVRDLFHRRRRAVPRVFVIGNVCASAICSQHRWWYTHEQPPQKGKP